MSSSLSRLSRNSRKTRICPRSAGFTLVEVLIALALCVGLAVAVSATVATCRRAEANADAAEQAANLIPTLLTAELLGQPPRRHGGARRGGAFAS